MKEYKGFLIVNDKFYIELSDIDETKKYEFKDGHLIQLKGNNRLVYKMNEYYSNKTIYDAIDIYIEYKDKEIPIQPNTIVYDYWFNLLKRDVISFKNTFGNNNLDKKFINLNDCLDFWIEFASKDNEMCLFLTDEKIEMFFNIQKETELIIKAKNKRLEYLVD